MKEITAEEAQRDFGRVMDEARAAPVRLVMDGHGEVVAMSREEFDRRQRAARDRLLALMDEAGAYAASQGLTDEILEELLADES